MMKCVREATSVRRTGMPRGAPAPRRGLNREARASLPWLSIRHLIDRTECWSL